MPRPLRILAAGYYGSANAGDEIVLAGILSALQATADSRRFELRALSAYPAHTTEIHGVRAYPRFSVIGLLSALRWCDCLVLGGGSLIQDVTSRRSASYYLWVMKIALAFGKKLFLWAQGFGPLHDPALRSSAARLITRAAAVTLRDIQSLEELMGLGVPKDLLHLSADPAFALQTETPEPPLQPELLGVALRSWPGIETHESDIATACASFASQIGLKTLFVPFQQPEDLAIANRTAREAHVPAAVLSARPGPAQMVELFDGMALVCAMRLHALILAARAHVPFLGLVYDPKVARFCEAAGMPGLTLEEAGWDSVLAALSGLWEARAEHVARLKSFSEEQKELALQTAQLFWSVISG